MDAEIYLCGRLPRAQSKSFFDLGEDAGKWQQKFFDLDKWQSSAHCFFLTAAPDFGIFQSANFLLARTLCNGSLDLGENSAHGRLLLSQSGRLDQVRAVVVVIGIHLDL
jgi:hypothetical protein